jgi:hypothetical protein
LFGTVTFRRKNFDTEKFGAVIQPHKIIIPDAEPATMERREMYSDTIVSRVREDRHGIVE